MVSDWNEKKMVCVDAEGQYLLNFKDKELKRYIKEELDV